MSEISTYVYVRRSGQGSTVRGDREFTSVGQRIELSEKDFDELVRGGGAFIPLALFEKAGFDDKDLIKYGPGYYGDFDPNFLDKCAEAADMFRQLYQSVLLAKGLPEFETPKAVLTL
jgi:hypothetical protein